MRRHSTDTSYFNFYNNVHTERTPNVNIIIITFGYFTVPRYRYYIIRAYCACLRVVVVVVGRWCYRRFYEHSRVRVWTTYSYYDIIIIIIFFSWPARARVKTKKHERTCGPLIAAARPRFVNPHFSRRHSSHDVTILWWWRCESYTYMRRTVRRQYYYDIAAMTTHVLDVIRW